MDLSYKSLKCFKCFICHTALIIEILIYNNITQNIILLKS